MYLVASLGFDHQIGGLQDTKDPPPSKRGHFAASIPDSVEGAFCYGSELVKANVWRFVGWEIVRGHRRLVLGEGPVA